MYKRVFNIPDALMSLAPGAQWLMEGEEYAGLNWIDSVIPKPTESEVMSEVSRLQGEYDTLEYRRLRAPEYPDFKEYLDGIVKNDQAQIDAYIAACQAVKDKYPKPE